MNINYFVLMILWLMLPLLLWKTVPKTRLREGIATFVFMQCLTWIFSIMLTSHGVLESPFRIFTYATKISFTMEFLVYPTIAVLFQMTFPQNVGYFKRSIHYLLCIGVILLTILIIGSYTDLLIVSMDLLIRSAFNFLIELWLCRHYVLWLTEHTDTSRLDAHAN